MSLPKVAACYECDTWGPGKWVAIALGSGIMHFLCAKCRKGKARVPKKGKP